MNHIAGRHELGDIALERAVRRNPRHRIEERSVRSCRPGYRRHPGACWGYMGNIVADMPEHRVDGGFAGGAGADHIADISDRKTFFF